MQRFSELTEQLSRACAGAGGEPLLGADDAPLALEFAGEALEHLNRAEAALRRLQGLADAEAVHEVFRSFHTIKGVAGFLNLERIVALAHAAEGVLAGVRDGRVGLGDGVEEAVRESVEVARAMVRCVEQAAQSVVAGGAGGPAVQGMFHRIERVTGDAAAKAGREIEFVACGEAVELDSATERAVGEALVHLVRNSVAHGIESPEERVQAGKSRVGRIELRAWREGGQVVLALVDDGRGIDKARVLEEALEAGLVKEGAGLWDAQVLELIFRPGLSTAPGVSELAGRGVGLDVVKRNVDAMRGRIDVASTPGKGTTFTIRLPHADGGRGYTAPPCSNSSKAC